MNETQQHPTVQQLAAYSSGKLNDDRSQQVEDHLSQCDACARVAMDLPDDSLVQLLRPEDEPVYEETVMVESTAAKKPTTLPPAEQGTLPPGGSDTDVQTKVEADRQEADLEIPPELVSHDRYEILERLGKGGMGHVYKAQHRIMNRPVALKIIKQELMDHPGAVQRFHREIQAASKLSHPNIVTAFDADHAGNSHFFVMEYVDGVDLDQVVKERGALPVEESCEYIRQTALGLQHAHEQGMVHRDIKPHNLMVCRSRLPSGTLGESDSSAAGYVDEASGPARQAGPTVKILDFGLANFANEAAAEEVEEASPEHQAPVAAVLNQLTQMGTMMGTPDYIAPEQAEDAHTADIRSDIYSLGCTFYTLLTGKAPFGEGSVIDKIRAHTEKDPPPLADFRNDVPVEVGAIVQKMMAKDPAVRFQTPAEVVEALSSVERASKPVHLSTERPDGLGSPSYGRRWPLRTTLAAALVGVILLGVVLFIVTDTGTVVIESPTDELQLVILDEGNEVKKVDVNKGQTRVRLRSGHYTVDLRGNTSEFTLSKEKILLVSRGKDVLIKIESKPTPKVSQSVDIDDARSAVVNWLELLDAGNYAKCYEMAAPRLKEIVSQDAFTQSTTAAIQATGPVESRVEKSYTTGASGYGSHVTFVFQTSFQRAGEIPEVVAVALEADGRWRLFRYVVRLDPEIVRAEGGSSTPGVSQLAEVRRFAGHTGTVTCVDVSSDGRYGLSCSGWPDGDESLRLWDLATGKQLRKFDEHTGQVMRAFFSPDGRLVISGGSDQTARVWDVETGKEIAQLIGEKRGWVHSMAISADGTHALVGSGNNDGSFHLWDLRSKEIVKTLDGDSGRDLALAISPDQTRALTAREDDVAVWDLKSGKQLRTLEGHGQKNQFVQSIVFAKDSRRALTAGLDRTIRIWDVETGEELQRFVGHTDGVLSARFTPDERSVVSGSHDQTLRVWDAETGKEVARATSPTGSVWGVAVTPDGRYLLAGGGNKQTGEQRTDFELRLWQLSETPQTAKQPLTEQFTKSLVSKAAGIPVSQWWTVAGDIKGPSSDAVDGTPLSLWMWTINPFEIAKKNANVKKDFWFLTRELPDPGDLNEAMFLSEKQGYVSLLQPEYITNVTIDVEGDTARGTVGFVVPKLYTGQVDFVARRGSDGWEVVEFELPNYEVTLRRSDDGVWRTLKLTEQLKVPDR